MSSMRQRLSHLGSRLAQALIDPLAITAPGWGRVMMAAGPCRNGRRHVCPQRLERGLVLVLPGIEGPSFYAAGLRAGLAEGGVQAALAVCNWADPWPGVLFAFWRDGARRQAGLVADRIRQYRRDCPGRPVAVVGHSGGAAIALFAAEQLAEAPLDGVIALSTPLSPGYDLTAALAGSRRLVCGWSHRDLQLRLLTTVGVNFDGVHGRTAGQEGFACARATGGDRLAELAWRPDMRACGHWGGHLGWCRPSFVREHLAPLVAEWLAGGGPAPPDRE